MDMNQKKWGWSIWLALLHTHRMYIMLAKIRRKKREKEEGKSSF